LLNSHKWLWHPKTNTESLRGSLSATKFGLCHNLQKSWKHLSLKAQKIVRRVRRAQALHTIQQIIATTQRDEMALPPAVEPAEPAPDPTPSAAITEKIAEQQPFTNNLDKQTGAKTGCDEQPRQSTGSPEEAPPAEPALPAPTPAATPPTK
jgi:hypothetical protein